MSLRQVWERKRARWLSRRTWRELRSRRPLLLYAGNLPAAAGYDRFIGLSLWKNDARHVCHDIRRRHPLPAGVVDVYQAEDVFEHIAYDELPAINADIHRILRPGGIFRLSLPDYRADVLLARCRRAADGDILFDPGGGGRLLAGRVVGGGHLWFPRFESVRDLLERSPFRGHCAFLQHYDENGVPVLKEIDYSIGFVRRTPDHDPRVMNPRRPLSIVVDAVKKA